MKTIEQRATEYACDDGVMPDSPECESCFNIYGKCTRDAYIAGAKSEHEGLTRWHDPKEELPPAETVVLVKITYGCGYALAERGDEGQGWCELHQEPVCYIEICDAADCEVLIKKVEYAENNVGRARSDGGNDRGWKDDEEKAAFR